MKPPNKLKGVLEGLLLIQYKQLLKYSYYMNLTTATTMRQLESMQILLVPRHIDNWRRHQVWCIPRVFTVAGVGPIIRIALKQQE